MINARILTAGLVIIASVALINQPKSSKPKIIEDESVQLASCD